MLPPSERDEDELFFSRVIKALHFSFTKSTIVRDYSPVEERDRFFERFEIYMYLPPSLTSLDGDNIESVVFFDQLGFEAVRAIEERYDKIKTGLVAPPAGIGIHAETEWRFGSEVIEAEGMLGDKTGKGQYPVSVAFWARFVAPIGDTARRCTSARVALPPPLPPDDYKEWVIDENGIIREEMNIPDLQRKEVLRTYRLRPEEKPYFFPLDDRDGYEEDPEDDSELDWKDS